MFALLFVALESVHGAACAAGPAWRPGPAPAHNPACDICTDDPAGICAWSGNPATSFLVNDHGYVDETPWFHHSNTSMTTNTQNHE